MRRSTLVFAIATTVGATLWFADRRQHAYQLRAVGSELDACMERINARERLEDGLERSLVERLKPGTPTESLPLYRMLIDGVVTNVDPEFAQYKELIAQSSEHSGRSFEGMEFHELWFLSKSGSSMYHYIVAVRNDHCEFVFLAEVGWLPV